MRARPHRQSDRARQGAARPLAAAYSTVIV
jgi:hypothetical protein